MRTPFLLFCLSPVIISAQTSAPVQAPSPVASTVVYQAPSAAESFVSAHAGATLVKAESGKLTFQNANHSTTMVSGPGVAYQQNGVWAPVKLQVAAFNDGSGWTVAGVPINVSLAGQGQTKDLSFSSGSVTVNFHLPQLIYNGNDTFNFQENGTTWLLRVAASSVSIEATIAKRTGPSVHTFNYNSFGSALTVDSKGTLHVGGAVHVTRPIVVGADKKIYGVCSAWSNNTGGLSFSCDDTALPATAFPYVIDPTFSTG